MLEESCLNRANVRMIYANWLASFPWHFFLTITLKEPCPMRRQESVTHAVGQSLKARYGTVEMLALFAEPHLSHNLHLHGLVKLDAVQPIVEYARRDMQMWLKEKFGRSQAAYPRGQAAVAKYVSKYCVKTSGYYELW